MPSITPPRERFGLDVIAKQLYLQEVKSGGVKSVLDSEALSALPEHIKPVYPCEGVNQPIQLLKGRARLTDARTNTSYDCEGELNFVWLPKPDLVAKLVVESNDLELFMEFSRQISGSCPVDAAHMLIEFEGVPATLKVFPSKRRVEYSGAHTTVELEGIIEELFTIGIARELDYAILHLVNFHNFNGKPLRDGGQRIEWRTSEWHITIDQRPDIYEVHKQLGAGGYAITHTVKVKRADGEPFSTENFQELLKALGLFFTFLRGAWSLPMLVVGFDSKESRCWEYWTTPDLSKIHSGNALPNWFPDMNSTSIQQLSSLLERFLELWKHLEWRKALRLSIGWYAESSGTRRLVEGQLITAQIALELLSWRIIVEWEQLETEESFRKGKFKTAEAKVARLLQWAGIPNQIPEECSSLHPHAAQNGWNSGTQAVTRLRNIIIHASKKNRDEYYDTDLSVFWDASQLALLYTELVLLRLLGYEGVYHNRIKHQWKGKTELVPWVKEARRHEPAGGD